MLSAEVGVVAGDDRGKADGAVGRDAEHDFAVLHLGGQAHPVVANLLHIHLPSIGHGGICIPLVNDIIMPSISLAFGDDKSLADLAFKGIKYGNFLQTIVDFLIIALSIFLAIRLICKLRIRSKKQEEEKPAEPAAPAPTPEDILLLREIRDALKNK